jgi:hypothetical protein
MRRTTRVMAASLVLMLCLAATSAKARSDGAVAHVTARHPVHTDALGYDPNKNLCDVPGGGCAISMVVVR